MFLIDGNGELRFRWNEYSSFIKKTITSTLTNPEDRAGLLQFNKKNTFENTPYGWPVDMAEGIKEGVEGFEFNKRGKSRLSSPAMAIALARLDSVEISVGHQRSLFIIKYGVNHMKHNPCQIKDLSKLQSYSGRLSSYRVVLLLVGKDVDATSLSCITDNVSTEIVEVDPVSWSCNKLVRHTMAPSPPVCAHLNEECSSELACCFSEERTLACYEKELWDSTNRCKVEGECEATRTGPWSPRDNDNTSDIMTTNGCQCLEEWHWKGKSRTGCLTTDATQEPFCIVDRGSCQGLTPARTELKSGGNVTIDTCNPTCSKI